MGETSLPCQKPPEACCLEIHETIILLIALIVLVQLALKLATVICYYIWYLLESLFEIIFSKAPKQSGAITPTTRSRKAHYRRPPSEQFSQQDLPRRHRHSENQSPGRHCLHCTVEPLQLTLDMQRDETRPSHKRPHSARRPPPNYIRCYNCECDCFPRPASAPSGYPVIRYKDVGCGTSDTMLKTGGNATEGHGGQAGVGPNDPYPRTQVGETPFHSTGHDADFSPGMGLTRSRRPAKVYIYPVHPQTPPGSRSTSPERSLHRRRNTPIQTPEELRGSYEPRELRRKVRDAEEQLGMSSIPRYRSMAASPSRAQPMTPLPTDPKQRFYVTEPLTSTPAQDWVYRSLK